MNKDVLYKLVDSNDFRGKDIVNSLRTLLSFFRLPGEGQKVDRIMEKFGEKYVKDNPGTVGDSECIYLLSYSIMMLQTGLHNPSAKQLGMGMVDFKKQARLIKPDFSDEFLEEIFYIIEKEPISLKEDDDARLKQESSNASSYKRKQEIFIKEGQGLAKRGYDLMKDKKKTTQFILVNNSDAIGPLFESCWSAMFAVFSMLLELHDDQNILALCIDGFLHSIKICGYYNMKTERNAFVSSLVNFTGIYKVTDNDSLLKREFTEKNVKCTQAIIHLAMHEGNYLSDSWRDILKVVSMINYYHNVGSGARGYQDLFSGMESRSSDPEAEMIKAHNAAHILTAIEEGDIDMIFSNSKALNQFAIVDLIKSMCSVSSQELKKAEGPRIFLLQKLVEVCDMNMNRARIEFSNMWNGMKDHISNVGSHENEQVAVYAIDSLRQLAKKFLDKEELNNYHFQKHFLEPFNIIVLNNMPLRMGIIHFIMSCMCSFAKQMTKNLKSGWEIIIEIFKFGGENDNDELSREAIETLNIILEKDNFVYVEEYFEKLINCLVKFMNNTFEEHAMLALDLIERVSTYLGESNEFVERIIEKSREMFNTQQEKLEYKKRLWKCVLYELSKKSFEPKTNVTQRATQLMFSLLTKYNEVISPTLWDMIMRDLLKAIFDDVHIKLESKSTDQEMHNAYLANTDTMVSNLIGLFNTMQDEKFSASVKILFDTIKNFTLDYPNSPVSNVMLEGMKELSKHCRDRFDKDLCKAYIDVVCSLFDIREDKNLLEPNNEIEKEESKYGSRQRLTFIYQTQASRLLKLIENGQQITEFFEILDSEDCQRVLKIIEYAYDVSHDFNMNLQRRYDLYTKIDLKTMHEKIPILLKHHIKSLEIYYELLNGLYTNPKPGTDKEEVTSTIIDFSIKVLKEFASNYDKMLHMGMELTAGQSQQKYGNIDFEEAIEEMKRILVSISDRVSNSVLKTLRNLSKTDLKPHVKVLTPLLIDCTVCDQLQFNLRLKEILKKMFRLLVDE